MEPGACFLAEKWYVTISMELGVWFLAKKKRNLPRSPTKAAGSSVNQRRHQQRCIIDVVIKDFVSPMPPSRAPPTTTPPSIPLTSPPPTPLATTPPSTLPTSATWRPPQHTATPPCFTHHASSCQQVLCRANAPPVICIRLLHFVPLSLSLFTTHPIISLS